MPKDLIEIEILVPGQHTASNGVQVEFTPADVQEIVDSYNPDHFRAPLIVSHDTQGIEDSTLAHTEFSYGIPDYLKVVGGKLKAVFSKVAPEFQDWVRDRKLHSISPSIYLRDSKANPYPGQLALRHIAALGASPPAIKALEPLYKAFEPVALSELCWEEGVEGAVSFSMPAGEETVNFCACSGTDVSPSVPTVMQRLREFLIAEFKLETADQVLPAQAIDSLRAEAKTTYAPMDVVERLFSELDNLRFRLEEMAMTRPSPTSYPYNYSEWVDFMKNGFGKELSRLMKDAGIDAAAGAEATGIDEAVISAFMTGEKMPSDDQMESLADALGADIEDLKSASKPPSSKKKETADMSEIQELREQLKLAQLEATHAKAMAKETNQRLKRTELANFCEDLVRDGRLLPSQSGTRCLDFGEGDNELTLVDFMCGLDSQQLAFFKDYLETQPVQVDFNEVAPASKAVERKTVDFGAADGYSVDSDRASEYQKVLDYCQQHNLDPKTQFSEAARTVLQGV